MTAAHGTGSLAGQDAALLDRLFSAAHVGLVIFDRELRYLRLNRTLAEINGLPVEDHIGRTTAELLPGLSSEVTAAHRRVLETGEPLIGIEVEGETPREPGRRRAWRVSYYPLTDEDGQIEGIGGLIVEITSERETREASEALQRLLDEEREILQRVVDRVPVGISLLWGRELRFRLVNARYHEFLPARGDPIGRTVEEVFPDQAHIVRELYVPVLDGETVTLKDYPVDFGGEVRHYTSTAIPMPGEAAASAGS